MVMNVFNCKNDCGKRKKIRTESGKKSGRSCEENRVGCKKSGIVTHGKGEKKDRLKALLEQRKDAANNAAI